MRSPEIQNTAYKVADFVSWSRSGTLTIAPDFQRRSVWKADTRSYFMDTVVRGFPTPPLFLRDKGINSKFEPIREVIDGQQRLRTILAYIDPSLVERYDPLKDAFVVKKVHNKDLADKSFVELSEDLQRSILEYVFSVYILSSNVDDRDVLQIFRRMNSTSYNLNKQELRNATFFGEFKTSAYQLAAEQLNRWRSWRIFTIDDISRMNEVELTSEFMMLIINGEIKRYTQQAITDTYEKYDEVFSSRLEVEERYRNVMETVDDKFGREILPTARNRKSLLYALFAYVYDAIYTLGSKVDRKAHPKTIPLEHIARVKRSIEKIQERSAPEKVVIAVKKSTTDTSSRQALFEYLRG